MIRAVLDTNLVVSALLFDGIPAQVYKAGLTRQFQLVTSPDVLLELQQVLGYAKFNKYIARLQQTPAGLIRDYLMTAELVKPSIVSDNVVRDHKDKIILACAIGGSAKYIVTGDLDLLVLEQYEGIKIVSVATFWELLSAA